MERLSLPDTRLLKWSEEDKTADPEAIKLGAELDAGLDLFKDIQERYLPKDPVSKEGGGEESGVAAPPTYDDPVFETIAEESTTSPLSGLELPMSSDLHENTDNRFIPPNNDSLSKPNSDDIEVPKAHSYVMLAAIAANKDDID